MSLTNITWEEFDTYEQIEAPVPFDFRVHDGKYYTFGEFGVASVRRVFEIDSADVNEYLSGKRTAKEIRYKAECGHWPSTENEKVQSDRNYVIDTPTALIADPTSWQLFTQEELERLLPLAEQQWIDWKGQLPDGYTSPVRKRSLNSND